MERCGLGPRPREGRPCGVSLAFSPSPAIGVTDSPALLWPEVCLGLELTRPPQGPAVWFTPSTAPDGHLLAYRRTTPCQAQMCL